MTRTIRLDRTMTLASVALLATAIAACDKDKDKKEGAAGTAAAAASAAPASAGGGSGGAAKIGDSCKGISAMDGKIACDGNKVIFCSSFSNYEWKMQQECAAGQSCVVGADGKSASCK